MNKPTRSSCARIILGRATKERIFFTMSPEAIAERIKYMNFDRLIELSFFCMSEMPHQQLIEGLKMAGIQ